MAKKKQQRVTLPDGLRIALKNSGITPHELKAATGVDKAVISRFLTGTRDIRLETAEKLAAAVGLTVVIPPPPEKPDTDS